MIRVAEILATDAGCTETVTLAWDDRYRRRIVLTGDAGTVFLLDLPRAVELAAGQGIRLEDGRIIGVRAADEDLMEAGTADPLLLLRAAWHVGNRHLACQLLPGRLVLRRDHVIAAMLEGLGLSVTDGRGPFTPERGAYGHGHGHDH